MNTIRPSVLAGTFYSSDPDQLKNQINEFLEKAKKIKGIKNPKAVIVPHAGYQYSAQVAVHAYKQLINKNFNKIFIIGPSHRVLFQGIALTNFTDWKTPLGIIQASKLWKEIQNESSFSVLNEIHTFEHSIEVQLPFLQTILKKFTIIPLITGRIQNHKEIAGTIINYLDENSLLVISTDLSHYLSYKQAQKIDNKTNKQILNLDTEIDHEQACGADGVIISIEIAKLLKWKVKLLDYKNSGDTAYDKSKVVGYSSFIFYK